MTVGSSGRADGGDGGRGACVKRMGVGHSALAVSRDVRAASDDGR